MDLIAAVLALLFVAAIAYALGHLRGYGVGTEDTDCLVCRMRDELRHGLTERQREAMRRQGAKL